MRLASVAALEFSWRSHDKEDHYAGTREKEQHAPRCLDKAEMRPKGSWRKSACRVAAAGLHPSDAQPQAMNTPRLVSFFLKLATPFDPRGAMQRLTCIIFRVERLQRSKLPSAVPEGEFVQTVLGFC